MVSPAAAGAWLIAALVAAGAAAAQTVAGAPTAASVTIYRDGNLDAADMAELDPSQGLAMITETRIVDAPAGVSRIAFRGVADTMVPQTVALQGLPGVAVERNEDFDLLSPGSLVERSVGKTVQVIETPRRGPVRVRQAVIRSGPNGVVLDTNGQIEALGCGGPPTRLVFDEVPQGLGERPTFSVLANVPKAGRYTVKLSYLATGFTWAADYVARIRPDGRTLDLSGWLTLANKSAAGFDQAPTQVVAGQLQRDGDTKPPEAQPQVIEENCWGAEPEIASIPPLPVPMVARRMDMANEVNELVVTAQKRATVSDLGDYKLYTLPEPTTVAARQTKQVAFLEQTAVPFERVYVYRVNLNPNQQPDPEDEGDPPRVVLRLQNKPQFGLGKPLPAGTVSMMEPGGAGLVLAGQQKIVDTPVGLPLELEMGGAMDLAVHPRIVKDEIGAGVRTLSIVVSVANAKPAPVTLELQQPREGFEDFKLMRASRPAAVKAGDEVWTLRLAPGERAELRYVMRYKG